MKNNMSCNFHVFLLLSILYFSIFSLAKANPAYYYEDDYGKIYSTSTRQETRTINGSRNNVTVQNIKVSISKLTRMDFWRSERTNGECAHHHAVRTHYFMDKKEAAATTENKNKFLESAIAHSKKAIHYDDRATGLIEKNSINKKVYEGFLEKLQKEMDDNLNNSRYFGFGRYIPTVRYVVGTAVTIACAGGAWCLNSFVSVVDKRLVTEAGMQYLNATITQN